MNAVRRAVLARAHLQPYGDYGALHDYLPGEDARSIDWHASSHAGVLQVRERQPEPRLAWCAVVDGSESMNVGRRRSLADAAREAGRFWIECMAREDRWFEIETAAPRFSVSDTLSRALQILPLPAAVLVVSDFYDLAAEEHKLLRVLARRFDCTALIARDPWHAGLPLRGVVRVKDIESGAQRILHIGERERARYRDAILERQASIERLLHGARWRTASFDEYDGRTPVLRAFNFA